MFRLDVKMRTALCVILCSAVPLAGLSVIAYRASEAALAGLIDAALAKAVDGTLERIEDVDRELRTDLRAWSGIPVMQGVAAGDPGGAIAERLRRLGSGDGLIAGLLVLDARGATVASTGGRVSAARLDAGAVWRRARSGGRPAPLFLDDGPSDDAMMVLVEPIPSAQDAGRTIGALVAVIDSRYLRGELARIDLLGAAQGADRRLVLRGGPDGRVVYDSVGGSGTDAPDTPVALPASDGRVRIDLGGERYLAKLSTGEPVRGSESEEPFRWSLGVFVSERAAYAEVFDLRREFTIVALGFVVFAGIVGLWYSRSIVGPVATLADAARGLAAGRFDTPLPAVRHDELGELTASFAAMRDAVRDKELRLREEVEERRRTEVELIRARRDAEAASEMKSQFLANMSHEIRTPMNGVIGMTQLVLDSGLDARQRRFAQTAYNSAESLLQVINDILDFSKMEAGKVELHPVDFDLRELIEDVCAQLAGSAHAKGLELVCRVPGTRPAHVRGDDGRLRQVLYNLLGNAIKFTERGEVGVDVERMDPIPDGVRVRVTVHDTGIGIDAEARRRVFEHFQQADGSTTRRYGGTGLGLAISKQLVELMGGGIDLESVPGKGTRFTFTVMLRASDAVVRSPSRAGALAGARLLIVDDNATNREILDHQARAWGAHGTCVEGGHEAMAHLREAVSKGAPVRLAIVDFQMPGMDGLALARQIKRDPALAATRLVLLSSVSEAADEATCRNVGIDTCLLKPARQDELYRALVEALGDTDTDTEARAAVTPHAGDAAGAPHGALGAGPDPAADDRRRVLVVEDNPVNQMVAVAMLEALGYAVEVADDGRAAVDRLAAERFDAVLMDCNMPVMDGFLATRAVRDAERTDAARGRVPIIALTANALAEDRGRCLDAGMDDYLTKPFRREELVASLERWTGGGDEDGDASSAAA